MKKHKIKADSNFSSLVLDRKLHDWTKAENKEETAETMLAMSLPWRLDHENVVEDIEDEDAVCDVTVYQRVQHVSTC